MGKPTILPVKLCSTFCRSRSLQQIGAMEDFSGFIPSHVASPKSAMMRMRLSTSDLLGFTKRIVLSAYKLTLAMILRSGRGARMPCSVAARRRRWSGSIAKMNRSGYRGSPCRRPHACSIVSPVTPLRRHDNEAEDRRIAIQSRHRALKPSC